MPDEVWPAVVFTLVTLLDDPVAADLAVDAVEPVATAWDTAARIGLADRRLYLAANRCLAIAARRYRLNSSARCSGWWTTSTGVFARQTISPTG